MFLMALGALLVLGGVLYMARTAIWRGSLNGPDFPARSRHSGAATAWRGILGARNELAGHSPYGNRYSSAGFGGQFLASSSIGDGGKLARDR